MVQNCNSLYIIFSTYSQVLNKRAGLNKRAEWNFFWKLIIEQDGITSRVDFFWQSNKRAGGKVLKRRTISDNFGSESALCTVWDKMYTLPCNNKSCLQYSSSTCLFRQNGINEQKGQNPKINKRAGESKSEQRGQNDEKY